MALRRTSLLPYFLIPLVALACGSSNKNKKDSGPIGDDDDDIDAPVTQDCLADSSYTYTQGSNAFASSQGVGSARFMGAGDVLNADALFDALDLEFYGGVGTFGSGITAQNITLTGDELDYATCAMCVLVYADFDQNAGSGVDPVSQYYMATGGQVNITSTGTEGSAATTGNLTLTATNLAFEHVTIDSSTFESTAVGDGCTTGLANVSFDLAIEDAGGSAFAPVKNGIQGQRFRAHRIK